MYVAALFITIHKKTFYNYDPAVYLLEYKFIISKSFLLTASCKIIYTWWTGRAADRNQRPQPHKVCFIFKHILLCCACCRPFLLFITFDTSGNAAFQFDKSRIYCRYMCLLLNFFQGFQDLFYFIPPNTLHLKKKTKDRHTSVYIHGFSNKNQ